MKLKNLQIQHDEYWRDKPTHERYTGKVEFFNDKGEALTIRLREDQLAGIVELCSAGIVKAAQDASQSIVASLYPVLQIEEVTEENPSRDRDANE